MTSCRIPSDRPAVLVEAELAAVVAQLSLAVAVTAAGVLVLAELAAAAVTGY